MSLQRVTLSRVFNYSGVILVDIDPSMTVSEVRDLYAAAGRPELSNAEVRGPELLNNEHHYTFHIAAGTKGYADDDGDYDYDGEDQDLTEAQEAIAKVEICPDILKALKGFKKDVLPSTPKQAEVVGILIENDEDRFGVIAAPAASVPWFF